MTIFSGNKNESNKHKICLKHVGGPSFNQSKILEGKSHHNMYDKNKSVNIFSYIEKNVNLV